MVQKVGDEVGDEVGNLRSSCTSDKETSDRWVTRWEWQTVCVGRCEHVCGLRGRTDGGGGYEVAATTELVTSRRL